MFSSGQLFRANHRVKTFCCWQRFHWWLGSTENENTPRDTLIEEWQQWALGQLTTQSSCVDKKVLWNL